MIVAIDDKGACVSIAATATPLLKLFEGAPLDAVALSDRRFAVLTQKRVLQVFGPKEKTHAKLAEKRGPFLSLGAAPGALLSATLDGRVLAFDPVSLAERETYAVAHALAVTASDTHVFVACSDGALRRIERKGKHSDAFFRLPGPASSLALNARALVAIAADHLHAYDASDPAVPEDSEARHSFTALACGGDGVFAADASGGLWQVRERSRALLGTLPRGGIHALAADAEMLFVAQGEVVRVLDRSLAQRAEHRLKATMLLRL